MRVEKFLRNVAPAIAMAMAAGTAAGCGAGKFRMNGKEGAKLSELDLSGAAPDSVSLMGPDIVRITQGEVFTIALEGDEEAKERMRFILEDGTLSVLRDSESRGAETGSGRATVTVTMPPPRHLVVAGSGEVYSDALAREAEVTIAGSGSLETTGIEIDLLEVSIAGSGGYRASGTVGALDLSIAGSGSGDLGGLKAGKADVSIAGSGDATFSSDGTVEASIMGSGNVTVRGGATCRVRSFGSGSLTCERGETAGNEGE